VLFAELVATSAQVAATRARKAKVAALATCLAGLSPEEREPGAAFLAGEPRQGKIGLGYAAVQGVEPGAAALSATLRVLDVDRALAEIAALSGAGSQRARLARFAELLRSATEDEQRFLRRLLVGELRQGANEGVLAEAIAGAARVPPELVRRAAMLGGDLPSVAAAALGGGAEALARFRLALGRPLQPMLAASAGDPAEALEQLGRAGFEWKLDGARVQVHRDGDDVRVFSRQLNDVTAAVPEVVELARALPARRFALDGEVIALAPGGRPRPFQETMRRFGRRLDVAALGAELPLQPFFFDALHLEGEDLLDRPAEERWAALAELLPEAARVPRALVEHEEVAEAFFAAALAAGHEGVVAKALDAPYAAGRRGASWIKVKPAHTLDLVVLAAEWGSGRRSAWLSNLHLGARDPERGGFVMLGKTFKGMTDEILAWQTARLQELALGREGHVVHVRPELVVEIAFDGVQASTQYPGGVALRFARLKRYRPDKRAEDADTLEAVLAAGGRG
jgi:DNA ligase-1